MFNVRVENSIPFQKSIISLSVRETSASHQYVLHETQVSHLMIYPLVVKHDRRFYFIGFYASNVKRLLAC